MRNVILSWQRFLTPRRLNYAWIAGAVLWLAWLLSIVLGPGNVDLAGQVVGTDYLQFYTAGYTLRSGESARLYDMAYQARLEQELIGPELRAYHAFITPPFLAWLFVPFASLPYGVSFALWSLLGLAGLGLSLHLLRVENPSRRPAAGPRLQLSFGVTDGHGQRSLAIKKVETEVKNDIKGLINALKGEDAFVQYRSAKALEII